MMFNFNYLFSILFFVCISAHAFSQDAGPDDKTTTTKKEGKVKEKDEVSKNENKELKQIQQDLDLIKEDIHKILKKDSSAIRIAELSKQLQVKEGEVTSKTQELADFEVNKGKLDQEIITLQNSLGEKETELQLATNKNKEYVEHFKNETDRLKNAKYSDMDYHYLLYLHGQLKGNKDIAILVKQKNAIDKATKCLNSVYIKSSVSSALESLNIAFKYNTSNSEYDDLKYLLEKYCSKTKSFKEDMEQLRGKSDEEKRFTLTRKQSYYKDYAYISDVIQRFLSEEEKIPTPTATDCN